MELTGGILALPVQALHSGDGSWAAPHDLEVKADPSAKGFLLLAKNTQAVVGRCTPALLKEQGIRGQQLAVSLGHLLAAQHVKLIPHRLTVLEAPGPASDPGAVEVSGSDRRNHAVPSRERGRGRSHKARGVGSGIWDAARPGVLEVEVVLQPGLFVDAALQDGAPTGLNAYGRPIYSLLTDHLACEPGAGKAAHVEAVGSGAGPSDPDGAAASHSGPPAKRARVSGPGKDAGEQQDPGSGAGAAQAAAGEAAGGVAAADVVPTDKATAVGHDVRDEIFDIVRPAGWITEAQDPPGLKCTLYRYQRRALAWMRYREEGQGLDGVAASSIGEGGRSTLLEGPGDVLRSQGVESVGPVPCPPVGWPADGRMQLLWQRVRLKSGHVVYVNKQSGEVARVRPAAYPDLAPLRGGMLCDEMGLGKTVEVIALLLAHKDDPTRRGTPADLVRDDEAEELNGAAQRKQQVWGGTLIVTPPAILQQWATELSTHSNLRVEVYEGLKYQTKEVEKAARQEASRANRTAARSARAARLAAKAAVSEARRGRGRGRGSVRGRGQGTGGLADNGSSRSSGRKRRRKYNSDFESDESDTGGSTSEEEGGKGRQGTQDGAREEGRDVEMTEAERKARAAEEAAAEAQTAIDAAEAAAAAAAVAGDMGKEAAVAVKRLLSCDVVLTSYAVLSQEVYLDPEGVGSAARAAGQRHGGKRYEMPRSPLAQIAWHRLVLDEAQQVGIGVSGIALMAARLTAERRWCVTGTPVGAGGLADICGSLAALQFQPLDSPSVFQRLVSSIYLSGAAAGHAALVALLKPIMWRNSKAAAASDIALPPRHLSHVHLAMPPPEFAFYKHILEEARKARDAWRDHVLAAQLQAEEEAAAAQEAGGDGIHPRNHHHHGRRGKDKGGELARLAAGELQQLRLACVHPQLTAYWKALSAEMQLGEAGGGALSIAEIMARMRDQAQLHLQNAERDYCVAANALAAKLIRQLERLGGTAGGSSRTPSKKHKPQSPAAGAAGRGDRGRGGPEGESGRGQGRGRGRGRGAEPSQAEDRGDGGSSEEEGEEAVAAASAAEAADPVVKRARLVAEITLLLESSYRVGESGIAAVDAPTAGEAQGRGVFGDDKGEEVFEALDDITAADASIRSWRFVQVHTCTLLAAQYEAAGDSAKAAALRAEVEEKAGEVAETVQSALERAEAREAAELVRAEQLGHDLVAQWARATQEFHFPTNALAALGLDSGHDHGKAHEATGSGAGQFTAQAWLEAARGRYEAARAAEAASREEKLKAAASNPDQMQLVSLLGTEVTSRLAREEAGVMAVRTAVEALLGSGAAAEAAARCDAAHQALSNHNQGAGGSNGHVPDPSADWALYFNAPEVLMWRAVVLHDEPSQSKLDASRVVKGRMLPADDAVGMQQLHKHLNYARNTLKKRATTYWKSVEGNAVAQLLSHTPRDALQAGLDALRMQVELIRAWRELHLESLKVEVQRSNKEEVAASVADAAEGGGVRGAAAAARLSVDDLRIRVAELRQSCEELRSKKAYLVNQLLEAERPAAEARARDEGVAQGPAHESAEGPVAMEVDGDEGSGKANVGDSSDLIPQLIVPMPEGTALPPAAAAAVAAQVREAASAAVAAGPSALHSSGDGAGTSALAANRTKQGEGAKHTAPHGGSILHRALPMRTCTAPFERATGIAALLGGVWASVCLCGGCPGGVRLPPPPHIQATSAADKAAGSTHMGEVMDLTGDDGAVHALAAVQSMSADAVEGVLQASTSVASPHTHAAVGAAASNGSTQLESELALMAAGEGGEDTGVECAICKQELHEGDPLMVYECAHYYCEMCAANINATHKPACPMCRREVDPKKVYRVVAKRGSAASARHNPEVNMPEGPDIMRVKTLGSWMTKIDALLRRLLLLRARTPEQKSLVFSTFPPALDLVKQALRVNGLKSVGLAQRGRGARDAVAQFKSDPSVTVFLLTLQHGAAGLTLVAANHVFMLDVSSDPAIEQQAVARVHRIGQTRPVTVTRLLCDGTVEIQVLKALSRKQKLFVESHTDVHGNADMVAEGVAEGHAGTEGTQAEPHAGKMHGAGAEGGQGEEADAEYGDEIDAMAVAVPPPSKEKLEFAEAGDLLDALL